MMDLAGPSDVFDRANFLAKKNGNYDRYRITVMSTFGGEIRSSSGVRFQTAALPSPAVFAFDTVIVVGGPGVVEARHDRHLQKWLQVIYPLVGRIGSVCTGAYVIAGSGLLNGKRATTHWKHEAEFSRCYPEVELAIDSMYVRAGKIFTSAGCTAGIDLALSLVDEDHGRELAALTARELVVLQVRAAGQSQYSAALTSYASDAARVQKAVAYIREHLRSGAAVTDIAMHVCVSNRQLARDFKSALGTSPAEYVSMGRIELARDLLAGTKQPIEKIALRCGFSGRQQLSRIFQKKTGLSPKEFRDQFNLQSSKQQ